MGKVNIAREQIAWLREKLERWGDGLKPREMALTSTDVADLLAILSEYDALKAELERARPLLDAVTGADATIINACLHDFWGWLKVATNEDRRQVANILQAALDHRQAAAKRGEEKP